MKDGSTVRRSFPFAAVIGEDDYKLALLANAVDPLIGGVLAIGERGTAKSTLARAFAALLPASAEDQPIEPPFIELPLGASIDRLTGSIDTDQLLDGNGVKLKPGLLAAAHGGVLYADEVNLLGDHLVDVLLDAAAFGEVHVERDGVSARMPARFTLVGTMNPDEGELRPQLLDRFGLAVSITASREQDERVAIVTRRVDYERDPAAFAERYVATQSALADIVAQARTVVCDVELPEPLLAAISEICIRLNVEGLRADIVSARTAIALAALDDRRVAIERDVMTAVRLALPHRIAAVDHGAGSAELIETTAAEILGMSNSKESDRPPAMTSAGQRSAGLATPPDQQQEQDAVDSSTTSSNAQRPPVPVPYATAGQTPRAAAGRGLRASAGERPPVDAQPVASDQATTAGLDPVATARAVVTRRLVAAANGRTDPGDETVIPQVDPGDLRAPIRSGRESNLLLCVVDASSSVLEGGRASELRELLGGMVKDAKRKRDRIGLIVFRGREARLIAPPSRNHAAVLSGLDTIDPGGTTPLAEGIHVAHQTALRELRRNPGLRPIVALVTDGYANISRSGSHNANALAEAREAAARLKRDKIALIVIGESDSGAPAFARQSGADFFPFDDTRRGDEQRIA